MTRGLLTFVLLFCSPGLTAHVGHAPLDARQQSGPDPPTQVRLTGNLTGNLTGTVIDSSGAAIPGVRIAVVPGPSSTGAGAETVTDATGGFSLQGLVSGPFSLTVEAAGFTRLSIGLVISPGQTKVLEPLTLAIAPVRSNVEVTLTSKEIAAEQLKVEERQRLFGVLPNYFVTYLPEAAPLTPKQKFELTWKFTLDPSAFAVTGVIAGVEQAANGYAGFGQGAQGYGKRYGAAYANFAIANVLGSAVLPALLKQDPRYFVKGHGPVRARLFYALSNSVVRKGDNRHWQPDYSAILGNLGSGAVSTLYYPSANRNSVALTFENAAIGIAGAAAADVLQEFLFRKITPTTSRKHTSLP